MRGKFVRPAGLLGSRDLPERSLLHWCSYPTFAWSGSAFAPFDTKVRSEPADRAKDWQLATFCSSELGLSATGIRLILLKDLEARAAGRDLMR
jgi:hypothetical protein